MALTRVVGRGSEDMTLVRVDEALRGCMAAVGVALSLAMLTAPCTAVAQTRPKITSLGIDPPRSILFVGNSFFYFNNGIDGQLARLYESGDSAYALTNTLVTISGSSLQWHDVESYFRRNAISSFTFDRQNNIVFNHADKLFDVTVMMDCSQCPIHPKLKGQFAEYVRKDADIVRRHGARPVLFMTWAYADRPEMTAELAEAYTTAGNDNDVLVIPGGLAFARVVRDFPDIGLYDGDKRHPSFAGTYLAASTVYAALFGRSPAGLKYTAGLGERTSRHLREMAWAAVKEYYGN